MTRSKLLPTTDSLFGNKFTVDTFLDSFFKDDFWNMFDALNKNSPYPTDSYWDKDRNYNIEVPLAGYKKEDITLQVDGEYLNLQVKKRQKKTDVTYKLEEVRKKELNLRWYLNDTFDKETISSSFEDGLLKITLPLKVIKEKEKDTRTISIS
jgi:HSP20 family molecular chaperone IbpA